MGRYFAIQKIVDMEYNRIISVTGHPGLFELISSKNDGAIVRGLEDNTTRFVSNRNNQFSHLESIEIYTHKDNVNLIDVLLAMNSSTESLPTVLDGKTLKAYFTKVYPDMDMDRVYASDMKKMVKWLGILKTSGVELKKPETDDTEESTTEVSA